MDMVFRIVPSHTHDSLTKQTKRAIILGISHVLVSLVNLIFGIAGLPELANFLLLICLFELLSCPKVKACMRTGNSQGTGSEAEENETEPEDEADCKKATKLLDSDDVPTEAGFSTDEGETSSEVEVTSGAEDDSPGSATDADCKVSTASENLDEELPQVVRTERPRWADIEEDEDEVQLGTSASEREVSTSDSEPEMNQNEPSDSEPEVLLWQAEPERTLYQRSPSAPTPTTTIPAKTQKKSKWSHSSEWIHSSPKTKWEKSASETYSSPRSKWEAPASEQVIWKHGGSESDLMVDTMLYKRGSHLDYDVSETQPKSHYELDGPKARLSKKTGRGLDYDTYETQSKSDYDAFKKQLVTKSKSEYYSSGRKLDYDVFETQTKADHCVSETLSKSDYYSKGLKRDYDLSETQSKADYDLSGPEEQSPKHWKSPNSWSKVNFKTTLVPNDKYSSPSSNPKQSKSASPSGSVALYKANDNSSHSWHKTTSSKASKSK